MTQADLDRIKAIKARNLAAMEAEKAAKAAEDARMAEAQKRAAERFPADMVKMVDLVLTCPGRPLPSRTVARLKEIRLRNEIMAEVARLSAK
jgi:hypothetical protein